MKKAIWLLMSLSMIPTAATAQESAASSSDAPNYVNMNASQTYAALLAAATTTDGTAAKPEDKKTRLTTRTIVLYTVDTTLSSTGNTVLSPNNIAGSVTPSLSDSATLNCVNETAAALYSTIAKSPDSARLLHRLPMSALQVEVLNDSKSSGVPVKSLDYGLYINDDLFYLQAVLDKNGKCWHPSAEQLTQQLSNWEAMIENLNSLTALANKNPDAAKSSDAESVVGYGYGGPNGGALSTNGSLSMSARGIKP